MHPATPVDPNPSALHIAVVGAGLLGRLIAWRLLCQGHVVSLYEATSFQQPRCAAHTAAAMISPMSEVVTSERGIYDMGMASLKLWPQWIAQLNQTLNASPLIQFSASGSLVVAHPQDLAELKQFKQDLAVRLGADDSSQWLDGEGIGALEPQLTHFRQGLFLPDEAYLDNRRLLAVLLEQIIALGGQCHEHTTLALTDSRITDSVDHVFDCRGIGAKSDNTQLRGVRGEVMWIATDELQLSHAVRLCHPRYKLYVVPKPNQQFIIGATEIESEDLSPISLQSTLELASALYTIHPALAEARVIETDVNLRPAFRDNMPRVTQQGKVIAVNGLYRHGYLLAPVLVEQALSLLSNQYPIAKTLHAN